MTKEKILAMEVGEELDKLVAIKVMNWYQVGVTTCIVDGDYYREPVWTDIKQADPLGWGRPKGLCIPISNWKPSSNISAAWQAMEKVGLAIFRLNDKNWAACIASHIYSIEITQDHYADPYIVVCRGAPEAICKAALLAKLEAA